MAKFSLTEQFIDNYRDRKPPFGFDGLGELVYLRTYSRLKEDGTNESWWETVRRVVEGTYEMQREWIEQHSLGWNPWKAQKSAQEMYDRIYNMKFLPPGRGLWAMGTSMTRDKKLFAALNNCGFTSTATIKEDLSKPFCFLMDMSMLGVGIGFDLKGEGKIVVKGLDTDKESETFVIPDTREGWVESVRLLIDAFLTGGKPIEFDYSDIRPAGEPIKGFGGIASGPEPLEKLHKEIHESMGANVGELITATTIVDVMNMIGKCVVAGNVRRTAEIVFGDPFSDEYLDLKNYDVNPQRAEYGWTSNNSIFAQLGMDYGPACERVVKNGEPGFAWLDNMQNYSRMNNGPDFKDTRAAGGNPCLEQTLESYELCCVSADTRILTREGNPRIGDVVGVEVEVWNGVEWSKTVPFKAGNNSIMYRVTMSDGSVLDVTGNHEWSVRRSTEKTFKKVPTEHLEVGMRVESFELNPVESGKHEPAAYEYGWFAGDGFMDDERPLAVVQQSEYDILYQINCIPYKEQHPDGYSNPFRRVSFAGVLETDACKALRDKNVGLPDDVFTWNSTSLLEFFGGWIDSDGSLRQQENTDNYVLFGTEQKLRDAQILLRRIGINHASIAEWHPEGHETNYGVRNVGLWCLLIPSYECAEIRTKIKKAVRIGSRFKTNNAHPTGKKIDAARKQRIVSIEQIGNQDSYCFTEPEKGMGVFGNCLTYQCLVESFPDRHEDLEDYLKTLKYAYLYAKTVTLGKTHWPETNRVLLRNRRIGCSVSGVAQFLTHRGIHSLREWLMEGYDEIQRLDRIYSDWLAVPRSIKTTSVKPSGTVSLLAGSTPGMHYPESRFYIRRIRLSVHSPLLKPLAKANYNIEPDQSDPENTMVVEIPVDVGEGIREVSEVSVWEQLSLAAFLQRHWADNQVSCTVTFDPEKEGKDVAYALNFFQYQLKGVSFLPKVEEGAYAQMPYEQIDEERYTAMRSALKSLNFSTMKSGEESKPEMYCSNDTCIIL